MGRQPDLEGDHLVVDVLTPPGEDPGRDPVGLERTGHGQPVLLSRPKDRLPHALRVKGRVLQVDLVSGLTGEPGPRDEHRKPVDLGLRQPEPGHLRGHVTDEVHHQPVRLRALDLDRRDVDLLDPDIEPLADVHPLQPQRQIRVGNTEPVLLGGEIFSNSGSLIIRPLTSHSTTYAARMDASRVTSLVTT